MNNIYLSSIIVFLAVILLGTVLLALPVSAGNGQSIGLFNSLFTFRRKPSEHPGRERRLSALSLRW